MVQPVPSDNHAGTPAPLTTASEPSGPGFTPGPWVIFSDQGSAYAIMPAMRAGDICMMSGREPERDANARLIAAAPALYAFVRLVARMEHSGDDGFSWLNNDPDDDRATLDSLITMARDHLGNAPRGDGGMGPATHEAGDDNGLNPNLPQGQSTNGLNP